MIARNTKYTTCPRQAAKEGAALGLSMWPARNDGSKAPIGSWKIGQSRRADAVEIDDWYGTGDEPKLDGVGVITGAVSGNLECFEFDSKGRSYEEFKARAVALGYGDLVEKVRGGYEERSASGGIHWFYFCSTIAGNTKLAQRPTGEVCPNTGRPLLEALIETRGEGGYTVIAPSHGRVHPSGRAYELLQGGLDTIATITPEEREALHNLARTFDEVPDPKGDHPEEAKAKKAYASDWDDIVGVIDDYNARADWADILNGWTTVYTAGEIKVLRRPGKRDGISATLNRNNSDRLFVFSTSTSFTAQQPYSKFAAYAHLNHGDDFSAASRALLMAGYGQFKAWVKQGDRWVLETLQNPCPGGMKIAKPGDGPPVEIKWPGANGKHKGSSRNGAPPEDGKPEAQAEPEPANRLTPTEGVVEAPDDPHRLGRTYVAERYHHPDHPRLVRRLDDFHEWRDGCYQLIPEGVAADNLTAGIKSQFDELCLREMEGYLKAKKEYDQKKAADPKILEKPPKVPVARKVTGKIHSDTMRALRSMVAIPHAPIPPFWLADLGDYPDPRQVLPTVDGLADLSSLEISDGGIDLHQIKVYEPTPAFFSSYVLGYSFDPSFPKPTRWLQFVKEAFPGDPEAQRELQKWFGLLISPDTSYQKILYLIGKTRSGKGTILRVLAHLIGRANITSPALVELANPHGLSDCVGKSVMLISDARIAGDDGALALLQERILKISGEDFVQINIKHRPQFTTKLPLRIVIASNSVPAFRDPSGAFRSRMQPLHFTQSFEGREDNRLFEDKLIPEMPGILNYAIIGKAMLLKDGGFRVPKSAADLVQALSESNPTQMFVDECCELKKDAITTKEDMFIAFQYWCQRTRNHVPPIQVFGKNLKAVAPEIKDARGRKENPAGGDDLRPSGYRGIALREDFAAAANAWEFHRQQGRTRV